MTRLSAAVAAALLATSVALAQDCRTRADAGATKCLAGVLYRCACSTVVGSTVCTWDNAASECSAISDHGGAAARAVGVAATAPEAGALGR
jgi:hypothetical protein